MDSAGDYVYARVSEWLGFGGAAALAVSNRFLLESATSPALVAQRAAQLQPLVGPTSTNSFVFLVSKDGGGFGNNHLGRGGHVGAAAAPLRPSDVSYALDPRAWENIEDGAARAWRVLTAAHALYVRALWRALRQLGGDACGGLGAFRDAVALMSQHYDEEEVVRAVLALRKEVGALVLLAHAYAAHRRTQGGSALGGPERGLLRGVLAALSHCSGGGPRVVLKYSTWGDHNPVGFRQRDVRRSERGALRDMVQYVLDFDAASGARDIPEVPAVFERLDQVLRRGHMTGLSPPRIELEWGRA